jgi:hypothetical protein
MQHVVELLKQREKGYGKFAQIKTSKKTVDDVVSNLIDIIQAKSNL